MTIVSTATYGLGAALAVGGAAYGAARVGLLPRWWSLVSSVGTAVAAVALVSYADSGLFSPTCSSRQWPASSSCGSF